MATEMPRPALQAKAARRVLIVSPHFPPVNAPDMQRVRMSLPFFREFGWEPYVLAVAPSTEQNIEPLLTETVPADIVVERVHGLPRSMTRVLGIGNAALRALPALYRAGAQLIARHDIELVYFSTTMFFAMPLGRLWKWRHGTPYVLDIQDPWLSDYYETHPESKPPTKYSVARRLHGVLEPWTMKDADAIIAVSPSYIETLRKRYPWITAAMCRVLPFPVATDDFDLLEHRPQENPFFQPSDGRWHGVYTGAAGDFMAPALRILFRGLRDGLATAPACFDRVRLHFIGTAYATDGRAQKTVAPLAAQFGLQHVVDEQIERIPYFQALQVIKDSDCLVLIGSDDPTYVASKLRPYVFTQKPLLAIVHEDSEMLAPLKEAGALVVTFGSDGRDEEAAAILVRSWQELLRPRQLQTHLPDSFRGFSARENARQQCVVFDEVFERSETPSTVPCTN